MKKTILFVMLLTLVFSVKANTWSVNEASPAEVYAWGINDDAQEKADYPKNVKDTIAAEIVKRADVDVTFTNDETYPWVISSGVIQNGNSGVRYSTSVISFSYTSDYRTEVSFEWRCARYDMHELKLYIDGVYDSYTTSSSFSSKRFYLEPGTHVITLQDTIGNTTNTSNKGYLRNVNVKNISPLEECVLSEKSLPLTFKNDGRWPWTVEDGYIQNTNYGTSNSVSSFSTTFKIDKISKLSFECWVNRYDENTTDASKYHALSLYINGIEYNYSISVSSWYKKSIALEPGEYTVVFKDNIYSTTTAYYSRIRNIELSSEWLDIELSSAGTLGVEVLYQVNVLSDVEFLKVKGNLNSTDWTNIGQMRNLIALDLSEAKFDAVPNSAFSGCYQLSNIKLPEGVKTIGEYAFSGKPLLSIEIPSTVTSIGQYAFNSSGLLSINFKEDSKLQTIGYRAFNECSYLREFIMPNSVTKLGTYQNQSDKECSVFNECTSLKKIHFSNSLERLEANVCYYCTNLTEVVLPQEVQHINDYAFYYNLKLRKIDFPESLSRIDYCAFYECALDSVKLPLKLSALESYSFYSCDSLKYIELPSYIESYNSNFNYCDAVEKVVCRSATPPAITNDPFAYGRSKSKITLVVPSFAVANYKLDTYWYQFGSIVEGDDIDYWKVTGALSLTNNRRMNGKPDIDLYYGGRFTVGGNAPMEANLFNLYINESNPGSLLNDCAAMTADTLNTYYSVEANKWYFFTPLHDVDLSKVTHSSNASYVFRYYDGASRATSGTGNSWRNVDTGKLIAGQGYIFHCNAAGTITMPADATGGGQVFNVNDVTKTLSAYESAASANKSWNYVGNPYPSYYDIYYMDFTAPITVWTGSTYKAYSIADDNFVLRPMQPFFVQKPDEIDNIIFHKEGRQLTSAIERPSYMNARTRGLGASRFFFDLQIANDDEEIDETRIVINDEAKLEYEVESDASKFMSIKEDVPQIFSMDANGNSYAINERPISDSIVNIGYRASEAGYYTISTTRADGGIILYDKKTNKAVDLTSQDYYFYSEATDGADNARFILKLKTNDSDVTNINNAGISNITVKGSKGCIYISCDEQSKVYVYTTDGHKVCEEVTTGGNTTINLPGGIYVVKVNNSIFKAVVL